MAAPTVIKWSDAGSPALTRTASSFIGVLDYCLPQRGWVKEFSGTDKAVYRAGSGNKKFFRILNDHTVHQLYNATPYIYSMITGYDSMSDVDTGAGWAPVSQYIMLSLPENVIRPWVCIFDEKTVVFITAPHASTTSAIGTCSSMVHAFGDTLSMLPGQSARSFIAAQKQMQNGDMSVLSLLDTTGIAVNRSIDGTRTTISAKLKRNGGDPGNYYDSCPVGNWVNCRLAYPHNGSLIYGRPYIDDAIDYSMGDYIPGLYYPCHKGNGFDNMGLYTDVDTGEVFMAVLIVATAAPFAAKPVNPSTSYGAVLIALGDWDAA